MPFYDIGEIANVTMGICIFATLTVTHFNKMPVAAFVKCILEKLGDVNDPTLPKVVFGKIIIIVCVTQL